MPNKRATTMALAWWYAAERGYTIPLGEETRQGSYAVDMGGNVKLGLRKDGAPKASLTSGFLDIVAMNPATGRIMGVQVTSWDGMRSRLDKIQNHDNLDALLLAGVIVVCLGVKTIPGIDGSFPYRDIVLPCHPVEQCWARADLKTSKGFINTQALQESLWDG